MRQQLIVTILICALLAAVYACDADRVTPSDLPPKPSPYQNLTQPEHVLINLELAINERNYDEYKRLVDPEFVFWFSPDDVGRRNIPEKWGRAGELPAVANMFDPDYADAYAVLSIQLSLEYTEEDWTPVGPPDTLLYAGETWYKKVFHYGFTVQAEPDNTFIADDVTAEVVVREEGGTWRIVEWRDETTAARDKIDGIANSAVQTSTWGGVKTLYKGDPGYQDLACRDDVLTNLELAFPSRDVVEYNRLLEDEGYVFFFGGDDGGNFTEFTKQQELQTMRNMADDTRPDAVLSIHLSLDYAKCEWTAIIPTDPQYDGETWYQKTVSYSFTIQAEPDNTFIADGIKAQFTIRQGKDMDGKTDIWRIVRWRDDIEGGVATSRSAADSYVKDTSWGAIKALYE